MEQKIKIKNKCDRILEAGMNLEQYRIRPGEEMFVSIGVFELLDNAYPDCLEVLGTTIKKLAKIRKEDRLEVEQI